MSDEFDKTEEEIMEVVDEVGAEADTEPDFNEFVSMEDDETSIDSTLGDDEIDAHDILARADDDTGDLSDDELELIERARILAIPVCDTTAAMEKLNQVITNTPKEVLQEAFEDPNSQINILRKIIMADTSAKDIKQETLSAKGDRELSKRVATDEYVLGDASPVNKANLNGKVITDAKQAELLILSTERDLRKIFLYNSGIDITIKGPALGELNNYYQKIHSDVELYGKEFGAYFFLFSDILIKQATIELMQQLIVNSSLRNWQGDSGNNILKAISIYDYDVILWAIGHLMHREGFNYDIACPAEDCDFHESMTIDLKKLRFNDFTLLPEECRKAIGDPSPKSLKNLEKYRRDLGLSRKIPLHGNWVAVTKVPSLYEYMEFGRAFNASLIENVHLQDKGKLNQYLQFNYYKIYTPWIEEVRLMNDDGSINFIVKGIQPIMNILNTEQLEGSNFADKIKDFIKESAITVIAIPFEKCPKCGYIPPGAHNGLVAFDVQRSFFTQSVMKLNQNI